MRESKHPRLILHNFVSLHLCKELELIHKSSATVGYRQNVMSTTLSHLIATNSSPFIFPFLSIRERLQEKVEEFFGCEYELCIEFTGLISWSRGARIGWHSDDNRPYLKQRDFAAVCYLNSYGEDFKGGLFHFQDGEPSTIEPIAGDVVMYTADSRNIHCVDEITEGERLTLTLWFSRDGSHNEDAKLVSLLSQSLPRNIDYELGSFLPLPAPSNMYWFSSDQASTSMYQSGFDICFARINTLGFDLFSSNEKIAILASDSCYDFSEVLMEPLQIARGDELFSKKFANILHVLQVVHFYCWKATEFQALEEEKETGSVIQLSQLHRESINGLKSIFLKDQQCAKSMFNNVNHRNHIDHSFNWVVFSAAIDAWEDYIYKLSKEMLARLPDWTTHQCLFSVPLMGLERGT